MENLAKFYIGGQWVDPVGTKEMPVINPATEEAFGTIKLGNAEDVDRAVAAATKAFESFGQSSKAERVALLERILDVSRARISDLAKAMTQEMGCPTTMSHDVQADAAVGHLEGFIKALKEQEETEELDNGDIIWREPIGVCGLITPWNWPINQVTLKVLPAIAAGCTCILKPSEHTPVSAVLYTEILEDAGVPPGVVNLIQGTGPEVGSALSKHPDVHMMSFTGSTRGGTAVSKDSADTVKRVTLELGGKSPNLVFADCDLEERVTGGVADCFINTGQSCDAATRMLVERSVYTKAVDIAVAAAEATKVDDPAKEGDHLGPLFDKIQYDRVQAEIEAGMKEAKLVCGGPGRPEGFNKGWYVRPTVFADVTNDMRLAQHEIFGPVLSILPFDTEEEAIAMANDSPYGLAAYLQTNDSERALRVAKRLRAGAVHLNGGYYQYGSPFGGYKQSGNGREGGAMGIEDYQEIKVFHPAPE